MATRALVLFGTAAAVLALPWAVAAQPVGDIFRKVSPAVVVIRATGRDVSGSGEVRFSEIGSGVLNSQDGSVMTAAHVVHAMDEILVQFMGGEIVTAPRRHLGIAQAVAHNEGQRGPKSMT